LIKNEANGKYTKNTIYPPSDDSGTLSTKKAAVARTMTARTACAMRSGRMKLVALMGMM
jgi:hypothetical protein